MNVVFDGARSGSSRDGQRRAVDDDYAVRGACNTFF